MYSWGRLAAMSANVEGLVLRNAVEGLAVYGAATPYRSRFEDGGYGVFLNGIQRSSVDACVFSNLQGPALFLAPPEGTSVTNSVFNQVGEGIHGAGVHSVANCTFRRASSYGIMYASRVVNTILSEVRNPLDNVLEAESVIVWEPLAGWDPDEFAGVMEVDPQFADEVLP